MAQTIKLKRGTAAPTTSNIVAGEVAIDTSAQKLYVNDSGTIKEIGGAGVAATFTVSANNSTDETVYPVFVDGATGAQGAETDTGLTYNPSSGLLTSTSFAGALTGNVTGNASGTAATVTTAAQPAITSLGTLTALAGGTGDLVWDTDTLFVDTSADQVGINKEPSKALDVSGEIRSESSSSYGRIWFGSQDNRYIAGNSAELQIGSTINQIHFQKTDGVGEIASSAASGTTAIKLLARTAHTSGNILHTVKMFGSKIIWICLFLTEKVTINIQTARSF